jgi:hypothetical protein
MGGCVRGQGRSCGNYACNGNLVCWTVCANNAQCAPRRTCHIHACQWTPLQADRAPTGGRCYAGRMIATFTCRPMFMRALCAMDSCGR